MKFVKYENCWWNVDEVIENNLVILNDWHGAGFRCDITNMKIIEAKDWNCLDWTNTTVYNDKSKTGWLDRQGKFYGCDYNCHVISADVIFFKTERELENLGYIKITGDDGFYFAQFSPRILSKNILPTKEQLAYLYSRTDVSYKAIITALESEKYTDERLHKAIDENNQNEDGKNHQNTL